MQSEDLIRDMRQGLLKWYDFKPHSHFLYIGDGSEACAALLSEITGQVSSTAAAQSADADLYEADLHETDLCEIDFYAADLHAADLSAASYKAFAGRLVCESAERTVDPQWQQEYTGSFDYIIAIETLERQESPGEFLRVWKRLLKPDGTLLLGMNNRFGLRYFCGDRDPYTGRNFDGIEGYRRAYSKKEDLFQGRCYSRSEIRKMLTDSGFESFQFYSVLTDLKNPSFLYAEDYLPNEDLSNRMFPTYNYPDTVFLEEESLYNSLAENGMFHEMANACLVECSLSGNLSDVCHVTSSMNRGPEQALLTIIHRSAEARNHTTHSAEVSKDAADHTPCPADCSGETAVRTPHPADPSEESAVRTLHPADCSRETAVRTLHPTDNSGETAVHMPYPAGRSGNKAVPGYVEKRAAHAAGRACLEKLIRHGRELSDHGIPVIEAELKQDSYIMPYVDAEVGQLYLKRLLHEDLEMFLVKMDEFRDLILRSSEIVRPDAGDGKGAVLRKGYLDMVPLNSFYIDDTFVFYDQEFCEENYPANALVWRMVATFYAGDLEVQKLLPMEVLLKRYGLTQRLEKWQKTEWDFLGELRQEKVLRQYHERYWRNYDIVNSNRQRLNYSSEEYQRLFVDIFRNADTRKLILFGSGNFTKRFLSLYRQDYPVYAVIDNNRDKWGQEIEGISIRPPEILKELQSGEYKVLICIKNYLSVMKQLDNMGVREYSIFDSGRDYPRKRRPLVPRTPDGIPSPNGNTAGKKKYHVGYIAGVFDLFHVGHLNMFKRAKEQCDYLIVGVVTDEGVRKFKEVEPFVPYEERVEMVRSCRYVDEVVEIPLHFGGTRDAWRLHHFDCQFSGSDYINNPDWLAEKEFLKKHGAEMEFFPYTQSTSSSRIKALIEKKLL